eukprot:947846_1
MSVDAQTLAYLREHGISMTAVRRLQRGDRHLPEIESQFTPPPAAQSQYATVPVAVAEPRSFDACMSLVDSVLTDAAPAPRRKKKKSGARRAKARTGGNRAGRFSR